MYAMMKRSHLSSFAAIGRAVVAAIAIAATATFAHAQSADLVLCDRLAADPADPDKPADVRGTPDVAASDIATAIKFCKVASGAPRRALCLRRRPRKITQVHWSGWARSRRKAAADRRMPQPPKPITNAPPHSATKTPRRR